MPLFELNGVISSLASRRPVFHSEADFQHALAWEIQEQYPDANIRLEVPMTSPEKPKIDILLRCQNLVTAIELKYKTAGSKFLINGELFSLRNHGAQDVNRCLVVKDLLRIEQLLLHHHINQGFIVFLTNDGLYWRDTDRQNTIDAAFKLHEGRTITGNLSWTEAAGTWTLKGVPKDMLIQGSYLCNWTDYSTPSNANKGTFRHLVFSVG